MDSDFPMLLPLPFILLKIRHVLTKRDKKRDSEVDDPTCDNVFIENSIDGIVVLKKVEKVLCFKTIIVFLMSDDRNTGIFGLDGPTKLGIPLCALNYSV
jgi:hypothetical protein